MFCSPTGCATYIDPAGKVPLLLDDDHLSNEGALLAARRIAAGHLLTGGNNNPVP